MKNNIIVLPDKILNFKFEHLEENQMSYASHFLRAARIGTSMIWSGSKTMIHALWPDAFPHSATDCVANLQEELSKELQAKKDMGKKKE